MKIKIWNPLWRNEDTAQVFETDPGHPSDALAVAQHFAEQRWRAYGKPEVMDLCLRVDGGEVQAVMVVAEQIVKFKAAFGSPA